MTERSGARAPGTAEDTAASPSAPWAVGPGAVWALLVALVTVLLGVTLARPDVALLGAGPVLLALRSRERVPRGALRVQVAVVADEPGPGTDEDAQPRSAPGTLAARVDLLAPPGADGVRLRVARPGHRTVEAVVAVGPDRTLRVATASVRTGPQELVHVDAQGLAAAGAVTGPTMRTPAPRVTVLPRPATAPALPLPPRLRGLTGAHGSRRPGDGGDLRDVHPFQPGDTVRQVDWRVTARRSPHVEELYVRRTHALAEAHAVLVVDSRDDVGPDPATWSGHVPVRPDEPTSLDLARQAAATVAAGYLAAGDRVGLQDLGVRGRTLPLGSGRRHLDRVVHRLAVVAPVGDPAPRVRAPQLPSGTLVLLFSTFLDDEPAHLARQWRHGGHRVVAVDVLPPVRRGGLTPAEGLALRLVEMERRDRVTGLAAVGVEVVRWADDGARARLRVMARRSHRPGARVGR